MNLIQVVEGRVVRHATARSAIPVGMRPIGRDPERLLPPRITELHRNFAAWGMIGLSPGPIVPQRVWIDEKGIPAFAFPDTIEPRPLTHVGLAPDLAAWLVLLDKWMETFVVVARARAVWDVAELAGALTFAAPAFLPRALVLTPPENSTRVARSLAQAVADGPLAGEPLDRSKKYEPIGS
jgi:hypothetical protein